MIFIGLTLIVVITIVFFVFNKSVLRQAAQTLSTTSETFPVPSLNDEKMSVKTSSGSVDVNNVYRNSLEKLSSNGVAFKDNRDYYMAYYPQDQGFLIVLHNADVKSALQKAESDFLQTLGITEDTACTLEVFVSVPYDVSPEAAGDIYGLSFCHDSKKLK